MRTATSYLFSSNGSGLTYLVDELGLLDIRQTMVSVDWDAEDTSFTWDASGNKKTNSGRGITDISVACPERSRRNTRNLPVGMSLSNGLEAFYRYNSAGWRIHKRVEDSGVPSVDEHYIMDGGTLLAVTDSSGNIKHWNLYGNGLVGRQESSGTKKYYLTDHLGSTRQVIDDTGTLLEYYDYYPFGLVLRSNVAGQQTKETFTGKEKDETTGYYYFGARYYDPALGVWGAMDPAGQFASPYVYAGNSPVMYTDPDGKVAWFVPVIIGAALGAYTGASIQSGTANFTQWDGDAWKGAIVGGIVGAGAGAMFSSAIGAAGMTTVTAEGATVASKGWGIATSIINNANINMGSAFLFSGGQASVDQLWKYGISGAASGAYSVTGGFGLVEGFGTNSKLLQFGGRLAYQSSSTALASVGNNWAAGRDPLSRVTVGVGPVNLTLGKNQRLLQWQNNIGNIFFNGVGLLNANKGGGVRWDWEHLTFNYWGADINEVYTRAAPGTDATGPHSIFAIGEQELFDRYAHELNHLWLSRALNDAYLPNYFLHGLNTFLGGRALFGRANYFERLGYGNAWGF